MIKVKNSVIKLVENAKNQINNLEVDDAIKMHSNTTNLFIDVRDIREIKKTGRILGAKHVPRCMLEFWIDPGSPYHKEFFNDNYHFVFYCASDWRSALATLAADEIGLLNTSHLIGGFNRWLEKNGPIEEPR
jgi:rhodanese-related sulfurtransferase